MALFRPAWLLIFVVHGASLQCSPATICCEEDFASCMGECECIFFTVGMTRGVNTLHIRFGEGVRRIEFSFKKKTLKDIGDVHPARARSTTPDQGDETTLPFSSPCRTTHDQGDKTTPPSSSSRRTTHNHAETSRVSWTSSSSTSVVVLFLSVFCLCCPASEEQKKQKEEEVVEASLPKPKVVHL
uniref:Secreted protein n=1 Tax=Magallana gigas TaxID=29159 RepID=A0A8W8MG72_MAGGI